MSARRNILTNKLVGSKPKKPRDTRTHDERVHELRKAFEVLKARAESSGSINECSAKKVLTYANVRDNYFYEDKLKDRSVNAKYHAVRDEIEAYKKSFKKDKDTIMEATALGQAIADRNKFEVERDNAHLQVAKIMKKNLQLEDDIKYFRQRKRETVDNSVAIAYSHLASKADNSNIISFNEPKIICPDDYLKDNKGRYDYSNQTKIDNAWTVAKSKLSLDVKNTHIPMRIYMLIGMQNAGKTLWRDDKKNYYNDRQPIVIDATNLNKATRADWFLELADIRQEIVTDKKDIKVCAVYFDVPLLQLQQRNSLRPPEKRIDSETLADNFNKLQAPDTSERFDEIIIVRKR